MIDIHMHIGRLYFDHQSLTPHYLLDFMDKNQITKAALLPIESPEECDYYVTTDFVVDVCRKYPERFIPFCNVDPRISNEDNYKQLYFRLKEYKQKGCIGYGEAMTALCIDDDRLQRIYDICGQLKFPIIFHMDSLRNVDEKGFPKFERMVKKFPDTVFIGHGQHFWSEISKDVEKKDFGGYPSGKIIDEGSIIKLLSHYSNVYADISAGSGYNALTRDSGYGYEFLKRFQDKLIFGTDICRFDQEVPIIAYLNNSLRDKLIDNTVYEKITNQNACRLFGLTTR